AKRRFPQGKPSGEIIASGGEHGHRAWSAPAIVRVVRPSTTDHNDGVFLQIVTDARNVGSHLKTRR
ncbi:MAG: hypothetical protein AAFX51_12210, partial [Cyanobacteria bacterium J06636_28]